MPQVVTLPASSTRNRRLPPTATGVSLYSTVPLLPGTGPQQNASPRGVSPQVCCVASAGSVTNSGFPIHRDGDVLFCGAAVSERLSESPAVCKSRVGQCTGVLPARDESAELVTPQPPMPVLVAHRAPHGRELAECAATPAVRIARGHERARVTVADSNGGETNAGRHGRRSIRPISCRVTETAAIAGSPAIGQRIGGNAAADQTTDADIQRHEPQAAGDCDRNGTIGTQAIAQLTAEAHAPTPGRAVQRESAGVTNRAIDRASL